MAKIAVYNEKGRVGKTYFACEIALRMQYNYATNQNRPRKHIEDMLPEGQFLQVGSSEEFPQLDDDFDVVFDLAGELVGYENSIVSALSQADVILVPVINDEDTPEATAYAIKELSTVDSITGQIVLLATDLNTKTDLDELAERMQPLLDKEYPVYPIHRTKAFAWMMREGKSISQIVKERVFLRYPFRTITRELDELFEYLNNEKKHD